MKEIGAVEVECQVKSTGLVASCFQMFSTLREDYQNYGVHLELESQIIITALHGSHSNVFYVVQSSESTIFFFEKRFEIFHISSVIHLIYAKAVISICYLLKIKLD